MGHDEQTLRDTQRKMHKVFRMAASDLSCGITCEDFTNQQANPIVLQYFKDLNVHPCEAQNVFKLLDINGSGAMGVDEFLAGCMRLQGPATALDFMLLLQAISQSNTRMQDLNDQVSCLRDRIE